MKANLYEDGDFIDTGFEIKPIERQLEYCFYCKVKDKCVGSLVLGCCERFPDGPPQTEQEVGLYIQDIYNLFFK